MGAPGAVTLWRGRARPGVFARRADERSQCARALTLRMMPHAGPDANLRLGQRGQYPARVRHRDEGIAIAPADGYPPAEAHSAPVEGAGRPGGCGQGLERGPDTGRGPVRVGGKPLS
jgi:hypothetical protein